MKKRKKETQKELRTMYKNLERYAAQINGGSLIPGMEMKRTRRSTKGVLTKVKNRPQY